MSIQTRRLLPRLIFAGAKLPLLDGISKYFQPKNSRPHDSWGPGAAFRALQDGGCGAASSSTFRRRVVAAFGLAIHPRRAIRFGFVTTATDYRASCHGLSWQLSRTIVAVATDVAQTIGAIVLRLSCPLPSHILLHCWPLGLFPVF